MHSGQSITAYNPGGHNLLVLHRRSDAAMSDDGREHPSVEGIAHGARQRCRRERLVQE